MGYYLAATDTIDFKHTSNIVITVIVANQYKIINMTHHNEHLSSQLHHAITDLGTNNDNIRTPQKKLNTLTTGLSYCDINNTGANSRKLGTL